MHLPPPYGCFLFLSLYLLTAGLWRVWVYLFSLGFSALESEDLEWLSDIPQVSDPFPALGSHWVTFGTNLEVLRNLLSACMPCPSFCSVTVLPSKKSCVLPGKGRVLLVLSSSVSGMTYHCLDFSSVKHLCVCGSQMNFQNSVLL